MILFSCLLLAIQDRPKAFGGEKRREGVLNRRIEVAAVRPSTRYFRERGAAESSGLYAVQSFPPFTPRCAGKPPRPALSSGK